MRRTEAIRLAIITIAGCLVIFFTQYDLRNLKWRSQTTSNVPNCNCEHTDLKLNRGHVAKEPDRKCPSAEPGHIPEAETLKDITEEQLIDVYHTYVSNTEVVCQKMLRMGHVGDGGWEVCDDPHVRPTQNNCIVYSFGINNDFSFDNMVGVYYGCEVHSFDPSMTMETSRRNEHVMFHRLGISGMNGVIQDSWPVNTLSKILKDLGHSQRRIDVLKMDIESSEWPTLKTGFEDGAFDNVAQVLIEVHGLLKSSKPEILEYLDNLRTLRLHGYRIFYSHKNSNCYERFKKRPLGYPLKTNCYEIHMMKIPSCASIKPLRGQDNIK